MLAWDWLLGNVVADTRPSCADHTRSLASASTGTSVSSHTEATSSATSSDTPSTRPSCAAHSTQWASVLTARAATSSTTPRRRAPCSSNSRTDPVLCASFRALAPARKLHHLPAVSAACPHRRPPPPLSPSHLWLLWRVRTRCLPARAPLRHRSRPTDSPSSTAWADPVWCWPSSSAASCSHEPVVEVPHTPVHPSPQHESSNLTVLRRLLNLFWVKMFFR